MKPAIVLDAAMTSAAAARRLDADAPDALVAVRRHGARGSKWYVVAAGALLEVLRSLDERTPLAKALTKMKLTPASAMQWTEVELPVRAPNTVVLDGLEVVGAVPPGEEKSAGLRGMLTGAAVAVGLYVLRSAIKGAGPLTVGPEVISTSTEAGPSPTFEAATDLRTWPLIAGPDAIEPEARFDLTISLRGDEIAGVKPLRLTLGEQGRATLDVHLSAAGLSAPEGWHRRLVSMAGSELPSVTIPLQADAGTRGAVVIHITFLQNGIVCGNAVHTVNVGTESAAGRGIGSPLTFPTAADEAADVTVFLTKADAAVDSGRFVWKTTSPHVDVDATPHLL
ncbi:MAG TPA: TCAD7 domain-containing protein, partial [Thermoanaerobaculia bacterium]